MRKHKASLETAHRCPPSRSALEHLAQRIGGEVRRAVPRIEPLVRREEQVPEEATGVSVGLDRTTVPKEEPLPPDQPPQPSHRPRQKPYVRTPPPPMEVNYRMAYVGTATLTDRYGEALLTRRYTARDDEGPDDVVGRMRAEVAAYLARQPALAVGIEQDGAPELWQVVRATLQQEPLVTSWAEAIDRYHLAERLGEALALLPLEEASRSQQLDAWERKLDASDDAIEEIHDTLIHWYVELDGAAAEKLWEHLVYIRNNKDRMRYVSLREQGLPVGSGATEGACKSVIGVRTKRASEHWRNVDLGSVLTPAGAASRMKIDHPSARLFMLRGSAADRWTTDLSDRLPRFWQRFRGRYTKAIEVVA